MCHRHNNNTPFNAQIVSMTQNPITNSKALKLLTGRAPLIIIIKIIINTVKTDLMNKYWFDFNELFYI